MQELIAELIEARKALYLAAAAEYKAEQEQSRLCLARQTAEQKNAAIERRLKAELDIAAGCPSPPKEGEEDSRKCILVSDLHGKGSIAYPALK